MDGPQLVAFEFDRVTVRRAGRRVLDEVTACIPAAGITVISGPSGAGKTTLLRLCNRLEVPDQGVVRYRGRPVDDLDPLALRRRAGMVFQRPTPFPGSVADNLAVAHPDAGAEGITIIWVTHDSAQADRVADQIYQLRDGHLTPAAGEARP